MDSAIPPGQLIAGRYELCELIGRGGHGAVYRAIQQPLGREVALKVIVAEALGTEHSFERFAREAALVQQLEHPNTIRLYDFGTSERGLPFMVFELLRGRTLEEELARGPLNASRTGHVAEQVLKSLMEAHARGIVHRDVKPSNIFLVDYPGEADFVKVLDFGVARSVVTPAGGKITRDGQIVGTPAYMAPEQIMNQGINPSTDLYSLGLVMAEALTGAPVFGGDSAMDIWMRQASADPVPLPPRLSATSLGPIIARATRKAQGERYPTAEIMLREIERALLASGGATDPLAKPLGTTPLASAPTAPFVVHTPPAVIPSTLPLIPPSHGPTANAASFGPPAVHGGSLPTPAPSASRGNTLAIVVAVLALLVAIGMGVVVVATRGSAPEGKTPPAKQPEVVLAGAPFKVVAHGKLANVTGASVVKRLQSDGWTIASVNENRSTGMYYVVINAGGKGVAVVQLHEYEAEVTAEGTRASMAKTGIGSVVERDGARVLFVGANGQAADSQALFDKLVK